MARRKVIDLNADQTIKFEKEGQQVEGYYLGYKTVSSKFGPSRLHIFQTAAGSLGAWGSQQIDEKLDKLVATMKAEGKSNLAPMTYVTYLKKIKVPNGSMKTFDVDFDDAITMDLGGITINYGETQEPEGSEDQGAEEQQQASDDAPADVDPEDSGDVEEEQQEPPRQLAKKGNAQVNAAQAKAAQDLLNKTRKKIA